LDGKLRQKKDTNIAVFTNEKSMLEMFINKMHLIDPDLLVAHNLCGGVFEVLLARIAMLRVQHWSRIGRLRKNTMPTRKMDSYGGASWVPRLVTCGRLLVDTFLNAKELVRETNYDLGHLCKTQLNKERKEFDEDLLPKLFMVSENLL